MPDLPAFDFFPFRLSGTVYGTLLNDPSILAALGEPYVLPGTLHHSTCSIGVTLFGKGTTSLNDLLQQADLAMYQAKSAGRNAVRFFDPAMQLHASANAQLVADLRQAWHQPFIH